MRLSSSQKSCIGFEIQPRKTVPYRPNTNGLCEKYNETIYKMTNGGVKDRDGDLGNYVFSTIQHTKNHPE